MNDALSEGSHAHITVDAGGRIVELDDLAGQLLGVAQSEAKGRPIAELVAPERLEADRWIGLRRAPSGEPVRKPEGRFERSARTDDFGQTRIELAVWHESGAEVEPALRALLDHTEEMAQIGSWDWDLESDQIRLSQNLIHIGGLETGDATPNLDSLLARVYPDDRARFEREIESVRRGTARPRPVEFRIVRSDGELRRLRTVRAIVVRAGGRLLGSVQDITEWHRAERRSATHVAISEALAEWQTLEQGATGLLRNLAEGLDCAAGILWLPEGDVLVAKAVWTSGSSALPELEPAVRQLRLPKGLGLAGRVWQVAEPVAVSDLAEDPRFPAAAMADVRGAVALPAGHAEEVLAVLEFYFCETVYAEETDRLVQTLSGVGAELGLFLAHRRGQLTPNVLTARERDVLQLAAQGHSGPEIAKRLVVSPSTVRTHFEHIYEKYGVSNRAAAVAKALRDGVIE